MRKILLLCMISLLLFGSVSRARADYYTYTDSHGVVSITNRLDSVPLKYRSKMKVIREDAPAKKDAGAIVGQQPQKGEEPAAAPSAGTAGKFDELSARFVWFRPLAYLCIFFASWSILAKICHVLPSRLLGKAIHVAFFFGVFLFLFKSYSNHAVQTYRKLREDAAVIVEKSKARQDAIPIDTATAPKAPETGQVSADRAQ